TIWRSDCQNWIGDGKRPVSMVPVTSVSTGQTTSSVTIVAVPIASRREMCIPAFIHTPLEVGKAVYLRGCRSCGHVARHMLSQQRISPFPLRSVTFHPRGSDRSRCRTVTVAQMRHPHGLRCSIACGEYSGLLSCRAAAHLLRG